MSREQFLGNSLSSFFLCLQKRKKHVNSLAVSSSLLSSLFFFVNHAIPFPGVCVVFYETFDCVRLMLKQRQGLRADLQNYHVLSISLSLSLSIAFRKKFSFPVCNLHRTFFSYSLMFSLKCQMGIFIVFKFFREFLKAILGWCVRIWRLRFFLENAVCFRKENTEENLMSGFWWRERERKRKFMEIAGIPNA